MYAVKVLATFMALGLQPLLAQSVITVEGDSGGTPYKVTLTGLGQRMPDGTYSEWKMEGQAGGVALAPKNLRNSDLDNSIVAGYSNGRPVLIPSVKRIQPTTLDQNMNAVRSIGVGAAQHYAARTVPSEYLSPANPSPATKLYGASTPQHTTQTLQDMTSETLRSVSGRQAYERDQAANLGFSNVSQYKAFLGQNRSKIRAAAKAGSADPLADVMAERDAGRAERDEIAQKAFNEAARTLDLGTPAERIAAAAGTSQRQQQYLNSMGMKSAAQQDADIARSRQELAQRRQAEVEAAKPVNRVRRTREELLRSVDAVIAKGEALKEGDFASMLAAITEVTKYQEAFKGLKKEPSIKGTRSAAIDGPSNEIIRKNLGVISEKRLPQALPVTQANLEDAMAVLEALELLAGMDLEY